jgi:hypothetical protein
MLKKYLPFIFAITCLGMNKMALADDPVKPLLTLNPKAQEVITNVNNAVNLYTEVGLKGLIDQINTPNSKFCQELPYGRTGISLITTEGVILANCKYPGIVGSNVLAWQTPDGKFIVQDLIKMANHQPHGAIVGENITNLNPVTGVPTERKQYVRRLGNLIFFDHIYDNTPLHKEVKSAENLKEAQDPNNAKSIDLKAIHTGL